MTKRTIGLFRMGILVLSMHFATSAVQAQCDFVNDISGITQSTPPAGDAADPNLYTQVYVLTDLDGSIVRTSNSPDFTAVSSGLYKLYAVNYINTDATAVTTLLASGQNWTGIENHKALGNCLDFTPAYNPTGSCEIISVCEQLDVCEFETVSKTTVGFQSVNHDQNYCLVCAGTVEALNTTGDFNLDNIAAASAGADCQIYALNYSSSAAPTLNVGDAWSTISNLNCSGAGCVDYAGLDLNISPISQTSGNGVATNIDFEDVSDGCAGGQSPVNNGTAQTVTVDNTCVPAYGAAINARPSVNNDDLVKHFSAIAQQSHRFPCTGTMDLTQNPIFFTAECVVISGVPTLEVVVDAAGPGITQVQAALYGPVNTACPNFTTGSFVDCGEDNNPSDATPLVLKTTSNPGDVFLVIVDTEGKDTFDINVLVTLDNQYTKLNGQALTKDNELTWTSTAQDLKGFELQRSRDGQLFTSIAQIDALTGQEDYVYLDENVENTTLYYRLKNINLNGEESIGETIALTRKTKNSLPVEIYPNPAREQLQVAFQTAEEEQVQYRLFNALGQQVIQGTYETTQGNNLLELSLRELPAASYILSIQIGQNIVQKRIIKQ